MNLKDYYDPNLTIHELEKQYIVNALKHFDGNKTQAANALGITIKTLYNKLHEHSVSESIIDEATDKNWRDRYGLYKEGE